MNQEKMLFYQALETYHIKEVQKTNTSLKRPFAFCNALQSFTANWVSFTIRRGDIFFTVKSPKGFPCFSNDCSSSFVSFFSEKTFAPTTVSPLSICFFFYALPDSLNLI